MNDVTSIMKGSKYYEDMMWAFLPLDLRECFEVVDIERSASSIDVWLDERREKSEEDASNSNIVSHGFTPYRRIQDQMAQGVPVYLHMRKCRWRDKESNRVFSYEIDFHNAPRTELSQGLANFLKGSN